MAEKVQVAFLWHFHQPHYLHPETNIPRLPWVRLHATRGYADMLAALERHSDARVTVNFVPTLIRQLKAYLAGSDDEWLRLSRRDPEAWTEVERQFLLDHMFAAQRTHMIEPLPRYRELLQQAESSAPFSNQDLLDLVVLFHLAWCGWSAREEDLIQELLFKERDYQVDDRDRLFAWQREFVGRILPRAKALAERGQVEISTTADHHPILPLLCELRSSDFVAAERGVEPFEFAFPGDAAHHVGRGIAEAERWLGSAYRRGMWPAEGAVSVAAANVFAAHGVAWIASDEDILFQSLGTHRQDRPDALYRAYHVDTDSKRLPIVFRDHDLSDRIGFQYQHWAAKDAVNDLAAAITRIGEQMSERALVCIILDGENPWEHYPDAGKDFMFELYRRLGEHDGMELCTVAEAIEQRRTVSLDGLVTGSWIGGSLDTWAGHPEKLKAWKLLADLRHKAGERSLDEMPKRLAASLRVLEGSDWYWWLGDDHITELSDHFDQLFLAHLRRGYQELGCVAPAALSLRGDGTDVYPIRVPRSQFDAGAMDLARVGGLATIPRQSGSMAHAEGPLAELYFARDDGWLWLEFHGAAANTVDVVSLTDAAESWESMFRNDEVARFRCRVKDPAARLRIRFSWHEDGLEQVWPREPGALRLELS